MENERDPNNIGKIGIQHERISETRGTPSNPKPADQPQKRHILVHLAVFIIATVLLTCMLSLLESMVGEPFARGLGAFQEQTWSALRSFQPWQLAARYWQHVSHNTHYCGAVTNYSIECSVGYRLGSGFGAVLLSPFTFPAELLSEPIGSIIVNFTQLIAGAIIAYSIVDRISHLRYLIWIVLTLICTTILSIPLLAAMNMFTLLLKGIFGASAASLGAYGGSVATFASAVSGKAFEHTLHTGLEKWLGVLANRLIQRGH